MKKHTLIVIGGVGDYRAYLDVPRKEAEARFWAEVYHGGPELIHSAKIKEFSFDEEFGTYDVWSVEPEEDVLDDMEDFR